MDNINKQLLLDITYRGALETCNYACGYCPFAKRKESPLKKQQDIIGLTNFIDWIAKQEQYLFNIFFTPWGEALVFKRYQQAIQQLLQFSHINKIVFQTNLSTKLDFLQDLDCSRLRFWCTYHPTEVTRQKFIQKTQQLDNYKVKHSVGMIGDPKLFTELKLLREELNPDTYLWINAYVVNNKHYQYTAEQLQFLSSIDPHFIINKVYASKGLPCFAGETAITIDEFGNIRRCHFIKQIIGNIKQVDWLQALKIRNCSQVSCDCHIGYIYLKSLQLEKVFGKQLTERIALRF